VDTLRPPAPPRFVVTVGAATHQYLEVHLLTLSLVRHGQTQYNAENRLQGWCDSPLTPQGLAGVRTSAAHLAGRPFTAAYVSPTGRAQATAHEILARHPSAKSVTDPDLREFGFGDFEARPEAALLSRYDPDKMFTEVLHGTFAGVPGGEAGSAFLARMCSAFARIEASHREGHVLVVSHGLTLRAYLTMIGSGPTLPLPNASITTVEVHPGGHRRVITTALEPAGPGERPRRSAKVRATI
jgi:2,3-bisphosphoglycerate-dependent phosphoglycerate mutase